MTDLTEPAAVVHGPVDDLVAQIRTGLSVAGYDADIDASAPAGASALVYVAGAPADYGHAPEELGAYVGAVLDGAAVLLQHLSADDSVERSIVLVAPSMGSTLAAGPQGISSAIGALKGLSRAWAVELGARGIRCNVVLPGILTRDVTDSPLLPTIPLEGPDDRIGTDADVTDAVVFLASADASYLNGTELDIDGGLKEHRHAYASVLWDEGLYTPDFWPF